MRIAFYTCLSPLFGRFCHSWESVLGAFGHEVTVVELPMNWKGRLPSQRKTDVNLFVGGGSMLWMLEAHGFPEVGKNVVWVFEPALKANVLTEIATKIVRRLKSAVGIEAKDFHYGKIKVMNEIGHRFDAIIGINSLITSYVEEHLPKIPTVEIPYTIDPKDIIAPLPEDEKEVGILQLGRHSSRRKKAEKLFDQKEVEAKFIYGGLYNEERYKVIRQSKISLQIHGGKPFYFSQHRIFEAWAGGSLVVTEPFSPKLDGVEEGTHVVVAKLEEFPEVCKSLLADRERRHRIVSASQDLLRRSFVPGKWSDSLVGFLASVR